jgi:hypothetical protein
MPAAARPIFVVGLDARCEIEPAGTLRQSCWQTLASIHR